MIFEQNNRNNNNNRIAGGRKKKWFGSSWVSLNAPLTSITDTQLKWAIVHHRVQIPVVRESPQSRVVPFGRWVVSGCLPRCAPVCVSVCRSSSDTWNSSHEPSEEPDDERAEQPAMEAPSAGALEADSRAWLSTPYRLAQEPIASQVSFWLLLQGHQREITSICFFYCDNFFFFLYLYIYIYLSIYCVLLSTSCSGDWSFFLSLFFFLSYFLAYLSRLG